MEIINAQIQLRCDSIENWETGNPVLAEGEPGVVIGGVNHGKIKFGDGVKSWDQLPFTGNLDIGNQIPSKSTLLSGTLDFNSLLPGFYHGTLTASMTNRPSTGMTSNGVQYQNFTLIVQEGSNLTKSQLFIQNSNLSFRTGYYSGSNLIWNTWKNVPVNLLTGQLPNSCFSLGSSGDMNNITSPGFYSAPDTYPNSYTNMPSGLNNEAMSIGVLVLDNGYGGNQSVSQLLYNSKGQCFIRGLYNGTWSSWSSLTSSGSGGGDATLAGNNEWTGVNFFKSYPGALVAEYRGWGTYVSRHWDINQNLELNQWYSSIPWSSLSDYDAGGNPPKEKQGVYSTGNNQWGIITYVDSSSQTVNIKGLGNTQQEYFLYQISVANALMGLVEALNSSTESYVTSISSSVSDTLLNITAISSNYQYYNYMEINGGVSLQLTVDYSLTGSYSPGSIISATGTYFRFRKVYHPTNHYECWECIIGNLSGVSDNSTVYFRDIAVRLSQNRSDGYYAYVQLVRSIAYASI